MTLIVARKVQNSIFVIGDTKLTNDKTKEKVSVSKGVIKTKLLSDHIAVSFAGNEHIAGEALRAVAGVDDLDVIARTLLAYHMSADEQYTADFVLASQKPAVDLVLIKAREIESAINAWIGDALAFELFRAYETGHRQPAQQVPNSALLSIEQVSDRTGDTPAAIEVYSNMLRCMKLVIDDEIATGVGGFAIPVMGSS